MFVVVALAIGESIKASVFPDEKDNRTLSNIVADAVNMLRLIFFNFDMKMERIVDSVGVDDAQIQRRPNRASALK